MAAAGVALVSLLAGFWQNLRLGLAMSFAALAGSLAAWLWAARRLDSPATLPREAPEDANPSSKGDPVPVRILLEAMMNGMREGVLVVDQSTRVVASNRAAREIFGPIKGELEARRLSELTRNPSIHAAFAAALNRGESADVKVEARGIERRAFDLRVVPLRLGEEKESQRGAIGVFFDITKLEHLERVRQEFLSNVSHELRTPLTAILAFVETLEEGAINDRKNNRRFLSVIRKNAARMHNLIDDILELSAIEAGNVSVEPLRLRLHPVVADIITALAARAAARGVTVHNEVAPEAVVFADPRRLEQMLTNLVDNAIKFNREGGRVTISHEGTSTRDQISVEDTGEGIPPEHIGRIFERFYRVDRARSREMGGTGLGLAIVKHLARAHGGEARVRSTPGLGSTFTIELPAGRQIKPVEAPPLNLTIESISDAPAPTLAATKTGP